MVKRSLSVVVLPILAVLIVGAPGAFTSQAAGDWSPCPPDTEVYGRDPFEIDLPDGEGMDNWKPTLDQNPARPGFQIQVFVCNVPVVVNVGQPSQATHYQILVRLSGAEEEYEREPRLLAVTGGEIIERTQKALGAFVINGVLYMRGYSTGLNAGGQQLDRDEDKLLTIIWDGRYGGLSTIDPVINFEVAEADGVGRFSVQQEQGGQNRVRLLMDGSLISRTENAISANPLTLFILDGHPFLTLEGDGSPCALHYPDNLVLDGMDVELDTRRIFNFGSIAPDLCVDRIP